MVEGNRDLPRFSTKEMEQGYVRHLVARKLEIQRQIVELSKEEDLVTKELKRAIKGVRKDAKDN